MSKIIIPEEMQAQDRQNPPNVFQETRDIISQGGQICLPFDCGDGMVTFSRWELAKLIERAFVEQKMPVRKPRVKA